MREETLRALVGEEGRFDSAGAFTMGKRSRQRAYRQTAPDYYLKGWIRAAILSGASAVQIVSNADEFSVSCDGEPFTLEQLGTLTDLRRAPQSRSAALAETSLGIAAALQRGHREVTVTSWDGDTCHRLVFNRKQTEIFTEPCGLPPGLRLRAGRAFLGGLKLIVGRLLARNQEAIQVSEVSRYSPVPIAVNGEPVEPPHITRVLLGEGSRMDKVLQKLVDRQIVSPTFHASDLLVQIYIRTKSGGKGLLCDCFLAEFSGQWVAPPETRVRTVCSDWRQTTDGPAAGFLAILGVEVAMEREASIE